MTPKDAMPSETADLSTAPDQTPADTPAPAAPRPLDTSAEPSGGRRPWGGLGFWNWLIYRSTWLAISPVLFGLARMKGFGHKEIPRDGKMLLLPNHHTMLDPFMAGWLPVRPCRFMASAQPLKTPVLGPYLKLLGAFPKKKFVKDKASMEELQRHYDAGHLVTIFPEGSRSWNGRTREIGEGIGRLVKRLGAPVVLSRLVTAHYFWPRWARYPRYVPVHIEYEGPLTYPESATAEQITEDIRRRLTCEQRLPERKLTFGFRMAHGLPAYLWACPSCYAEGSLRVHKRNGNRLVCLSCRAQWRVRVDTHLEPVRDHEGFSVADAYDRLVEYFGDRPVSCPDRFSERGVALEAPHGEMLRAREDSHGFSTVASGALRLTERGLEVGDDPWQLPFEDIVAVSVELGNKVQIRTNDGLFRMRPSDGAVLKWGHFVHEWRCAVQGLPRSPLG